MTTYRRKRTGADDLLEQLDHFRLAGNFSDRSFVIFGMNGSSALQCLRFSLLAQISHGRQFSYATLFTPVALSPLSSLPRDGET